jgi:DNA-binding MarR family transcriptional regulator
MHDHNKPLDVDALLRKAGLDEETISASLEIDAVLQNWRRRANKRELGRRALIELGVELDLAQLDVLVAIEAPQNEFGDQSDAETMVATVAERLALDPSRASRLVSEMVEAGYACRAVSQADARRTIIELTPTGQAIVQAVRAYKFLIFGDFLSGWSKDELALFTPLLNRFALWREHMEFGADKFSTDIDHLAQHIAKLKDT